MVLMLGACGGSPAGRPYVWLDVPQDGLSFPEVQEIKIEGHATASGGVTHVELWIDGVLLTTINDPIVDGALASFHTAWTPPMAGEYTIQAVAYGSDGSASAPDSARIIFGGATPTPVITDTPTPVISVTPELPSSASAVIQFWADPPEIQAGSCTTIHWHVENVQTVIFGGINQPLDGSYQDCLCANQRYTLTVVHADNTEEKRAVDIAVSGACVTPVPPQDTTPPDAPTPVVPNNDLSLSCRASQNLAWLPVNDPSGIAEYRLQVQRHSGDNNWQDVPGSVFSGISDKQKSVTVECGWYYRWRVRAVDGAGNTGPWSGWWRFSITLG
jgi:hypothetical protein